MGKSLGNFVTLPDLFKDFNPIVVRFYILQNHYRKPTDFNREGLENASKLYEKLEESVKNLRNEVSKLKLTTLEIVVEVEELKRKFLEAMDDDFNTGLALTYVLEAVKLINKELAGNKKASVLLALNNFITDCAENILGLKFDNVSDCKESELIEIISEIRNKYREDKNYEEADKLRDKLNGIGVTLNDRR